MAELITCPKCQHVRTPTDPGPEYECPSCGIIYAKYSAATDMRTRVRRAQISGDWSGIPHEHIPPEAYRQAAAGLPVTTGHFVPGREIAQLLDVVSAECVFGMNIFKDVFSSITDVIGGRSGTMQKSLREGRQKVMAQLRTEAFALGAEAVIGVAFDYSEISGGGKSMLFVVATGTAVKLAPVK